MGEWYVFEVCFIDIHLFAPAAATTTSTAGLSASAGRSAVVRVAGPAEKLHVVGDHVHCAPLGTVLGLPGAVLQAPLDEDRVALLLVVGDSLAELAPGGDVEEVHLLAARPHPVYRQPERADGYAVVGETQFWISGQVTGQYDTIEADHVSPPSLCLTGVTIQEHSRFSSATALAGRRWCCALQRFVVATFSSWSFMVAITSPSSSLRKIFAPALWSLSRVSGVGCPYGLSAPHWMTATLGGKRLRKSGVDEVLEPWWVTFRIVRGPVYGPFAMYSSSFASASPASRMRAVP